MRVGAPYIKIKAATTLISIINRLSNAVGSLWSIHGRNKHILRKELSSSLASVDIKAIRSRRFIAWTLEMSDAVSCSYQSVKMGKSVPDIIFVDIRSE